MSSPQTRPIDDLPQPTMRWRYFEPGIAAEEAQRARIEARIAAFWNDFVASAPRLDANFRGVEPWPEWVKWIDAHLHGICGRRMSFETSPGDQAGDHRLSLSAGWDPHVRAMISEIVAVAPPVPGFQIEAGYAAFDVENARRVFAGRQGGIYQGKRHVDLAGFRFKVSRGPCSVLKFNVEWPECRGSDDFEDGLIAIHALHALLGQDVVHHWMRKVEISAPRRGGWLAKLWSGKEKPDDAAWFGPDELRARTTALIAEIFAALPAQPLHAIPLEEPKPGEPIALEVEPRGKLKGDPRVGFNALVRAVVKAPFMPIFEAMINKLFHSRCHSRVGETFCYLKIGARPDDWTAFELGESLDRVLRAHEVGCVVWAGESPGQDYVAFALPDVAAALPVLRRYLQRLNVDRRGWLLFFDDDLEHEWLGVWPDSPAPHLHVYESLGG